MKVMTGGCLCGRVRAFTKCPAIWAVAGGTKIGSNTAGHAALQMLGMDAPWR